MRLGLLTFLAFQLNYLLDRGYYIFSIEEIKEKIRDKTLFDYLKKKTSTEDFLDLSLFTDDDKKKFLEQFEYMADNVNEDRKMGVLNNGLCLLLAYVIELIQQKRKEIINEH